MENKKHKRKQYQQPSLCFRLRLKIIQVKFAFKTLHRIFRLQWLIKIKMKFHWFHTSNPIESWLFLSSSILPSSIWGYPHKNSRRAIWRRGKNETWSSSTATTRSMAKRRSVVLLRPPSHELIYEGPLRYYKCNGGNN